MTDFIIVGRGLAATTLAHVFFQNNISFKIIGEPSLSRSSLVAAGIWNPVVFKRMTASWMAGTLTDHLIKFYTDAEKLTGRRFLTHRPIFKPFTEEQEKNLWLRKAEGSLENFIDNAQSEDLPELANCKIAMGYGTVKQAGNIRVSEFISASEIFFQTMIEHAVFDHAQLCIHPDAVEYKGLRAANIVFCEGHLVKNNPFFNWIPMKPAKGEVIRFTAPDLKLRNMVFNRNGFVLDTGDGDFIAGATYNWQDLTDAPSAAGLQELINKTEAMISCPYTVTGHEAGVRPSSIDRRPVCGVHPEHARLHVFNGLGTKGVMLAPYFAGNFVHFYLKNEPLNNEVNVSRFYHLYERAKK